MKENEVNQVIAIETKQVTKSEKTANKLQESQTCESSDAVKIPSPYSAFWNDTEKQIKNIAFRVNRYVVRKTLLKAAKRGYFVADSLEKVAEYTNNFTTDIKKNDVDTIETIGKIDYNDVHATIKSIKRALSIYGCKLYTEKNAEEKHAETIKKARITQLQSEITDANNKCIESVVKCDMETAKTFAALKLRLESELKELTA